MVLPSLTGLMAESGDSGMLLSASALGQIRWSLEKTDVPSRERVTKASPQEP